MYEFEQNEQDIPVKNVSRETPKWLGLGDVVAWAASRLGIHEWEGCKCKQRRKKLNAIQFKGIRRPSTW
jgi:hypothetical protein